VTKILVVDDAPVDQLLVGRLLEKCEGLTPIYASNGREALTLIVQEEPDLVLTDLQMPEMNGLELVREIRAKHADTPVILMTAHGSEEIAIQALKKGAANYVAKKNLAKDLPDVVESVLAAAFDQRLQQRLFQRLQRTERYFCLENDIALIAPLVDYLKEALIRSRLFDGTGLIRIGVALREAVMNAIVHGNLGVESELRDRDLDEYYRLIEIRRHEQPYSTRRVQVYTVEANDHVRYVVRDEGLGFDPNAVPDPTDPENMERASGRGLLLIRTFMDEVTHNERGNEITMVKRRDRAK
jgi:CheY-like chemotaxis protein